MTTIKIIAQSHTVELQVQMDSEELLNLIKKHAKVTVKKTFNKAYCSWTTEEDTKLLSHRGDTIKSLVELFQRSPSAIMSRLKKLEKDASKEAPNKVVEPITSVEPSKAVPELVDDSVSQSQDSDDGYCTAEDEPVPKVTSAPDAVKENYEKLKYQCKQVRLGKVKPAWMTSVFSYILDNPDGIHRAGNIHIHPPGKTLYPHIVISSILNNLSKMHILTKVEHGAYRLDENLLQ